MPSSTALVVDARALSASGIGRYTREVASRLIARGAFQQVLLAGNAAELAAWCAEIGAPPWATVLPLAGGRYSVATQLDWPRVARALPALSAKAVLWFPHWDAPMVLPRLPTVVTVHDLTHLRVSGSAGWAKRITMRLWLARVTRRARALLVLSNATRTDLAKLDPRLVPRITVVPGGVAARFLAGPAPDEQLPPRVRAPYLLAVGNRKPHKNLIALVRVLAALRQSDPALTLVVAGERFAHWRDVLAEASRLGVADSIVDLDLVTDGALAALYRNTDCFLFPSRYEGFGLPMLEAMACGAPVVASNATAIPEVAGDAALLFDPDDVGGMADAVRRVRSDPAFRAALVARGRARAREFTWDRTAEAMERVLLEAAGA